MAHLLIDRKTYLVTQCWALWDQLCEAESGGHGSVQAAPPLGQTERGSWQNRAARGLGSIPVNLKDRKVERKVENKKSEENELQSFLYPRGTSKHLVPMLQCLTVRGLKLTETVELQNDRKNHQI